jgi:hypothetical protein
MQCAWWSEAEYGRFQNRHTAEVAMPALGAARSGATGIIPRQESTSFMHQCCFGKLINNLELRKYYQESTVHRSYLSE